MLLIRGGSTLEHNNSIIRAGASKLQGLVAQLEPREFTHRERIVILRKFFCLRSLVARKRVNNARLIRVLWLRRKQVRELLTIFQTFV